jgi:hypothetical protein
MTAAQRLPVIVPGAPLPAGPILWSEVVSIGEEGKWHLALHPGAVYATRTRPLVIETNVLEGGRKRLPELMQDAHERWLERRAWDHGW